jgi:predicted O-methyltransferase YrrM
MPLRWQDIPGWFSDAEGAALQALSADRDVLELGSWLGRSTVCAALVARRVVAVDAFAGDEFTGPADTLQGFLVHLDQADVRRKVDVLVSRFEDVDWRMLAGKFDVAFVDGAHDAESVERDAQIALRCVKPGGVVCWHDAPMPSVQQGLAAVGLAEECRVDSLGWCVKGAE